MITVRSANEMMTEMKLDDYIFTSKLVKILNTNIVSSVKPIEGSYEWVHLTLVGKC